MGFPKYTAFVYRCRYVIHVGLVHVLVIGLLIARFDYDDVNSGRFCDSAIAMSDRFAVFASLISTSAFYIAFGTSILSTSSLVYVVALFSFSCLVACSHTTFQL